MFSGEAPTVIEGTSSDRAETKRVWRLPSATEISPQCFKKQRFSYFNILKMRREKRGVDLTATVQ